MSLWPILDPHKPGCKVIGYTEFGIPRWECINEQQTSLEVSQNGSPYSNFDGTLQPQVETITQGAINDQDIFDGNMLNYLLLTGGAVLIWTLIR